MNLKKNAGITLIALIITVVILLILVAVSVVALRDTNLFERTQRATQVYNESRLDEEEKLTGYKYVIDEHDPKVATISKLNGSSYLTLEITSNNYLTATVTAIKGNIEGLDFSSFRIFMASGNSGFVPTESDWTEKSSIEVTEPNTIVYAMLYDGTKYGASTSKLVTENDIDQVAPTATFANIKKSSNILFGIDGNVTLSDLGSGVDYSKCKYVFNNSANPLGENADLYTGGTLSGETTTVYGSGKAGTSTFYLHTLLVDNVGNTKEQISEGTSIAIDANKSFGYTGSSKLETIAKGNYKLEVWGAQGGNSSYGGKGAYAYGNIQFKDNTNIYVRVGGMGSQGNQSSTVAGGFNGGGNCPNSSSWYSPYPQSGGGASDIRIASDSLYSRVIVAGGGGGSSGISGSGGYGGAAGDLGTASSGTVWCCGGAGAGASISSGGAGGSAYSNGKYPGVAGTFGVGGNGSPVGSYNAGSGGGGGWYGGGGSSGGCGGSGGGGGSSYVYNTSTASNYPSGCLLNSNYYLTNSSAIAGTTNFTAPGGGNETGHTGHGYARITNLNT